MKTNFFCVPDHIRRARTAVLFFWGGSEGGETPFVRVRSTVVQNNQETRCIQWRKGTSHMRIHIHILEKAKIFDKYGLNGKRDRERGKQTIYRREKKPKTIKPDTESKKDIASSLSYKLFVFPSLCLSCH